MKKIGYIYKYSEIEKKGIIVYGTWKGCYRTQHDFIKDSPILFHESDCISKVSTGQIVYFDLFNDKISSIERASLLNFDKELMDKLIESSIASDSFDTIYQINTHIKYEDLSTIYMPDEDYIRFSASISGKSIEQEIENYKIVKEQFRDRLKKRKGLPSRGPVLPPIQLPESINLLFSCFGKYSHPNGTLGYYDNVTERDSKQINLLDLSLWIDSKICENESHFFGENISQIEYLYNVFVLKSKLDQSGTFIINNNPKNYNSISSAWILLLATYDENDLREIIKTAPLLQPVMPIDFCKKNLDLLTDAYRMPDTEICTLYSMYKVMNAVTVSDYKELSIKINNHFYDQLNNLSKEGARLCEMTDDYFDSLKVQLEKQFEFTILPGIIMKYWDLFGVDLRSFENENASISKDEFMCLGLFIDKYSSFLSNYLTGTTIRFKFLIKSYTNLPDKFHYLLNSVLRQRLHDIIISIAKEDATQPYSLTYILNNLPQELVINDINREITEIVNDRYSRLNDLEQLQYAHKAGFISEVQYISRYKQITKDYKEDQLIDLLNDFNIQNEPYELKQYLVLTLVDLFNFTSLSSYKPKKSALGISICNVRSLLNFYIEQEQSRKIDKTLLSQAQIKISSLLSDDERWTLFEEGLLETPGYTNIRKQLDKFYDGYSIKKEILCKECFQNLMYSDIQTNLDPRVKILIADELQGHHYGKLLKKCGGIIQLYLWAKEPNEAYDWQLIRNYLQDLPADYQIKVLRYIFYLISSGKLYLNITDLYNTFVNSEQKYCEAVRGILFIIKKKAEDENFHLSNIDLESIIGKQKKCIFNFLKYSKSLFYPCDGYLALSSIHSRSLYYNGEIKKYVEGAESFYEITFFEKPQYLNGKTIEWDDCHDIDIAKDTFVRNFPAEYKEGKYYIIDNYEKDLRHYVLDYDIIDKCNLFPDGPIISESRGIILSDPRYKNRKLAYNGISFSVCRCGCYEDKDCTSGIPYYWCDKKICVRSAHYFQPLQKWEDFTLSDFLYISMKHDKNRIDQIWSFTSEISEFYCKYLQTFSTPINGLISSCILSSKEIGVINQETSVFADRTDEEDYNVDEIDDYDNVEDEDDPTYDRYNGSWAQDEMGYSDDDIDTIFDGDPDAYWNID